MGTQGLVCFPFDARIVNHANIFGSESAHKIRRRSWSGHILIHVRQTSPPDKTKQIRHAVSVEALGENRALLSNDSLNNRFASPLGDTISTDNLSNGKDLELKGPESNLSLRRWICVDPTERGDNVYRHLKPVTPLSNCGACRNQNKYFSHHAAAAHLRRSHFPRQDKPKGNSEYSWESSHVWPRPSFHDLLHWIKELDAPRDEAENNDRGLGVKTSDGESEEINHDFLKSVLALRTSSLEKTNKEVHEQPTYPRKEEFRLPETHSKQDHTPLKRNPEAVRAETKRYEILRDLEKSVDGNWHPFYPIEHAARRPKQTEPTRNIDNDSRNKPLSSQIEPLEPRTQPKSKPKRSLTPRTGHAYRPSKFPDI